MKKTHRHIWIIYAIVCFGVFAALLFLRWYFREPPNYTKIEAYSEIEGGIYMGGSVDQPPPGAVAVLNLSLRKDTYQAEKHRWAPTRDSAPAPSLSWLQRMVDWVESQRRRGHTVYIHCMQGISRSGMVVVAYIMQKQNWSRDRALKYVRSKRPQVRPNTAFMELLLEWEAHIESKRQSS